MRAAGAQVTPAQRQLVRQQQAQDQMDALIAVLQKHGNARFVDDGAADGVAGNGREPAALRVDVNGGTVLPRLERHDERLMALADVPGEQLAEQPFHSRKLVEARAAALELRNHRSTHA